MPPRFVLGSATSAYQVEGAVAVDRRGESIWDRFAHTPGHVRAGDTGDVAVDHYGRFREDVAIMAGLGLGAYRFSVSWPRVIPDGIGAVNERGLAFYDRLVDELLAKGIVPHLTLYHWDLPQVLEDAGGWPVRSTAAAFADYAAVVAHRLGDRVRFIATLNEPFIVAELGYRLGIHAPGRREPAAALSASHNLLVGHGLAVQAIRSEAPEAAVGIVLDFEPKHPATGHPLDVEAAAAAHDVRNRWFLDPIAGLGYPETGARALGWTGREVEPGDMELIAERIDFLGVNYYSRRLVRSSLLPPMAAPPRELTGIGWEVYPAGLTEVLQFAASRTGALPLYVTENGAAYPLDTSDPTRDPERVTFLRRHLRATLAAVDAGVPVRGYFAWSLLDNFEWAEGYAARFGIVHVDFETLERRVRDSGRFLASVIRDGLPDAARSDAARSDAARSDAARSDAARSDAAPPSVGPAAAPSSIGPAAPLEAHP